MPELVEYRITLLDGLCAEPTLKEAPGGVRYGSLRAAVAEMGDTVKGLPSELSGLSELLQRPGPQGLSQLADGLDGPFIYVPEGVKAAGVFVVENRFTSRAGSSSVSNGADVVEAATESAVLLMDGAEATVHYEVRCEASSMPTDSRRVRLGRGASLRFEETVFGSGELRLGKYDDSEDTSGRISIDSYTLLGEGASMDAVTVEMGCAEASLRYKTDLVGCGAQTSQAGLFVLGGEDKADFDVVVNHLVADCRSDVLVKGVAGDNARGSFSGLVYVAQDAQHTEAYQRSRNLLLSDTAQIVTAPQLEIYADDVKCSHGATVGQMNDDAIYYMRQRGLSEEQARGLHMAGFVNDIVSRIGSESKRELIFNELKIDHKL